MASGIEGTDGSPPGLKEDAEVVCRLDARPRSRRLVLLLMEESLVAGVEALLSVALTHSVTLAPARRLPVTYKLRKKVLDQAGSSAYYELAAPICLGSVSAFEHPSRHTNCPDPSVES